MLPALADVHKDRRVYGRNQDIKGRTVGHAGKILVKDSPFLHPAGVPHPDGMIVVRAVDPTRVPVPGDEHDGVRIVISERVVEVSVVPSNISGRGAVDKGRRVGGGHQHIESCTIWHAGKILVKDSPFLHPAGVPYPDGAIIVRAADPTRVPVRVTNTMALGLSLVSGWSR